LLLAWRCCLLFLLLPCKQRLVLLHAGAQGEVCRGATEVFAEGHPLASLCYALHLRAGSEAAAAQLPTGLSDAHKESRQGAEVGSPPDWFQHYMQTAHKQ
jgi:hypothetical protein